MLKLDKLDDRKELICQNDPGGEIEKRRPAQRRMPASNIVMDVPARSGIEQSTCWLSILAMTCGLFGERKISM